MSWEKIALPGHFPGTRPAEGDSDPQKSGILNSVPSNTMPWLSSLEINRVSDYKHFRHVEALLRYQHEKTGQNDAEQARVSGYAKLEKFRAHREQWLILRRGIPRAFIEAIGCSLDELFRAVDADREEYERAIRLPRFPRYAVTRFMPAVYSTRTFPPGITEDEALAIMLRGRWRSCLKYEGLLSVFVEPREQQVNTVFHRPELKLTRKVILPSRDFSRVGLTRI